VGALTYRANLANKFYLGEVPPQSASSETGPEYAAINANPVDMCSVWAEGTLNGQPAAAHIWTVQACTVYRFPLEFLPSKFHFFDGTSPRIRYSDGQHEWSPTRNAVPESGGTIDTFTFESAGCA
jgi:hypothetical protein